MALPWVFLNHSVGGIMPPGGRAAMPPSFFNSVKLGEM